MKTLKFYMYTHVSEMIPYTKEHFICLSNLFIVSELPIRNTVKLASQLVLVEQKHSR